MDLGFERPSRGPRGHEWGYKMPRRVFYGIGSRGSEAHTSVYEFRCLEGVKMEMLVQICSAQEVTVMISPMKFGAVKSLQSVVNG